MELALVQQETILSTTTRLKLAIVTLDFMATTDSVEIAHTLYRIVMTVRDLIQQAQELN